MKNLPDGVTEEMCEHAYDSHPTPTAQELEKAKLIVFELDSRPDKSRPWRYWLEQHIALALAEAKKEGQSVGFSIGLKCEYRHKVGDPVCPECRAAGLEEAAKSLEMHADFLDQTKRFMIDPDYLRERAKAFRALAHPTEK